MHCKPGRVKELVTIFKQLNQIMKGMGHPLHRIMTDVSGERFWTVVSELEIEKLDLQEEIMRQTMGDPKVAEAMKNYHNLVEWGHREIFKLES
jgi:hypothetical protein